jgi:hypothetical protein
VSFYKRTRRWQAYIKKNGRVISLGYYATKEEALAVREAAEVEHFAEFRFKSRPK